VPDGRVIGGGGGGPPDARATGASGIGGGSGRIEVGCDDERRGGGGGIGGGGAGNAEPLDMAPGGAGQPVRVERETGATISPAAKPGGGGGTKAGAPSGCAAASELSAPGGRDQPLPFTSSSKTCKSSPPLPSDIDATPCSSRVRTGRARTKRAAIFPKAGPVGQGFFSYRTVC
jgi:hypothetical protein